MQQTEVKVFGAMVRGYNLELVKIAASADVEIMRATKNRLQDNEDA